MMSNAKPSPSSALPSSSSLSTQILSASFNQDGSCFAIGTTDGFKIFNVKSGRLCYERECGALCIVEMLYSSSLLAIVGAGEQPSLSPRRLCLFNTVKGTALRDLNFLTSVLAVRVNKKRLIVVLCDKAYIYDSNSLAILDTIDTVPNPKGLCAFSCSVDGCYLALPASTSKGSVLLYNAMELHSHCQIDAHQSPLAALVLSVDGTYIGTASEQGTIIRVHLSYNFRRGTYPSTITSLSFGSSKQAPNLLVATTSAGSVHVFSIGPVINRRPKRSVSLLTTIIPDKISDALDPGHHFVLQNAIPAGVKSCATIHVNDEAFAGPPVTSRTTSRASIFILSYNGYFQEYSLTLDDSGISTWKLEREFNLLIRM
ncbi:Autophagy-related protein 18b [Nymphaea thermarum]|nr:Autophagy-related protein 18b [Nymphaea thermarum]